MKKKFKETNHEKPFGWLVIHYEDTKTAIRVDKILTPGWIHENNLYKVYFDYLDYYGSNVYVSRIVLNVKVYTEDDANGYLNMLLEVINRLHSSGTIAEIDVKEWSGERLTCELSSHKEKNDDI